MGCCIDCKHIDTRKGLACMNLAYGWCLCSKGYKTVNFGKNLPLEMSLGCGLFEKSSLEEKKKLLELIKKCRTHLLTKIGRI